MSDLIDRQAAIDAFDCTNELIVGGEANARNVVNYINKVVGKINDLPSAQPEIIRCKDCKHRPKATRADEKIFYGFSVEFPDEKCPCYCEDGFYGWYPKDDFYCGYAERREVKDERD